MSLTKEQKDRYSRHISLAEIGEEGQETLIHSKVLVIGAGALGSTALLYLAGAGIGKIGIADADVVSLSNLQRQIIHKTSLCGKSKTSSAKQAILDLNPDINVIINEVYVNSENINEMISDYDFILDCTDNFESKFLINDACVRQKKPYSHAGVLRFGGQLMTYVPNEGPCLRCILGGIPDEKDIESPKNAGILGAVAGISGCIQAIEAIKYLTGTGRLLTGRLLKIDTLTMEHTLIKIPRSNPDCAVCGQRAKSIGSN